MPRDGRQAQGGAQSGPQLLAHDPAIPADDFAPAIWVPLSRLIAGRRRLRTMARQLPADAWDAPSACPGWRRRDVFAHIVSWDAQHLRSLDAVLQGHPLPVEGWLPDPGQPQLDSDAWNEQQVQAQQDLSLVELAAHSEANLTAILDRLAQIGPDQLLQPYGFAPHVIGAIESHVRHVNAHADDIVNGPATMRSG